MLDQSTVRMGPPEGAIGDACLARHDVPDGVGAGNAGAGAGVVVPEVHVVDGELAGVPDVRADGIAVGRCAEEHAGGLGPAALVGIPFVLLEEEATRVTASGRPCARTRR